MWKGRSQASTSPGVASCPPSRHILSSTPPTGNKLEDTLHSEARHSLQVKINDKNFWWNDPYWLKTAFDCDVAPMAVVRRHEHPRYLQEPSKIACDQEVDSLFETNDEGIYVNLRARDESIVKGSSVKAPLPPLSFPDKVRRLELSTQAFLKAAHPAPSKVSELPGLLSDSVLDAWEQPLIFPKRGVGQDRFWFMSASRSKKPLFRLVIDPPEGEEAFYEYRAMSRPCEQGGTELDEMFLLPPVKQHTRRDRKREELRMKLRLKARRI